MEDGIDTDYIDADQKREIKQLVKAEVVLSHEIHQELVEEHPEVAGLFSPSDILPKVDDALKWVKGRLSGDDDEDDSDGEFVESNEEMFG